MATRAKTKKPNASRARRPVVQSRGRVGMAVSDVEKAVRGVLNMVEARATRVEMMVRGGMARTLRDTAKQLKRLERAVAPPTRKKAKPKKKAAAGAKSTSAKKTQGTVLAA